MPHVLNDMNGDALTWVIRVRDSQFGDWEAFESWLAADPAHADAYHMLATADRELDGLLPAPQSGVRPPFQFEERRRPGRRRLLLGGVAAALIALLGSYALTFRPEPYRIATAPGVRRTVSLPGGTHIVLNGGTAILLDRRNPRSATLEDGEALFAVVHDQSKPFALRVGEDEILDVGTRFNVVRSGAATQVQVAEGYVAYNPEREALRLGPGDTLYAADAASTVIRGRIAPQDVATWRDGRLVFDGQPMSEVAAQLSRYTGSTIRTTNDISARPFLGVLNLTAPVDMAALAPVLGVKVQRDGDGWLLAPH